MDQSTLSDDRVAHVDIRFQWHIEGQVVLDTRTCRKISSTGFMKGTLKTSGLIFFMMEH